MNDNCKNCTFMGDYELCIKTECSQHESWFVKELMKRKNKLSDELYKIQEKEWRRRQREGW